VLGSNAGVGVADPAKIGGVGKVFLNLRRLLFGLETASIEGLAERFCERAAARLYPEVKAYLGEYLYDALLRSELKMSRLRVRV
jgi:hypothetical protein